MLENKVALVTGAAKGIGRAIALRLAEEKATVIVNYNGSKERAEEVVKMITDMGGRAESYQCNVADDEACQAMLRDIIKKYGHLDILVNNAGITRDISCNSCIIYKNIQMSVFLYDISEHGLTCLVICHIALIGFCSATHIGNHFYHFFSPFFTAIVIYNYRCFFFCQTKCNGTADSFGCTGYQCYFILQHRLYNPPVFQCLPF